MSRYFLQSAEWQLCLPRNFVRIVNREIDLAMLPINEVPPRFEARRLYDEDFVVAMRKGHPFARAPTEAAFCAAEHLLVSLNGDPLQPKIRRSLSSSGRCS